jgi:predicted alpha/beta-fold hydrolase
MSSLRAATALLRGDPFQPPRWMRSPHAQTLAGAVALGHTEPADRWIVASEPGTHLICDAHLGPPRERPAGGRRERALAVGAGALVVVHGMGGSSASVPVLDILRHARRRGLQVVRMNMRNCGGGEALTPSLYHGNLPVDLAAVVAEVVRRGVRRVVLAGHSVGGNLVLNTLAHWGRAAPPEVVGAVAVCPTLDVARCVARLSGPGNSLYHRHFLGLMRAFYARKAALFPDRFDRARLAGMKTMGDFDRLATGPDAGFADVDALYAWVGAASRLERIAVPALVVQSFDDPIVDLSRETRAALLDHPALSLVETAFGGHCGFVELPSRRRPDGRWAAAKVAEVAELWMA